jgi:siroheme synthase
VSWFELARTDHTLVILMGLARLREIAARLVAEGRDSATPVAVVQEASTPRQREVFGTLADIAERVQAAGIEAPATVIVGKVAGLGRGAPGSAQG